jgi:hypothetical protein
VAPEIGGQLSLMLLEDSADAIMFDGPFSAKTVAETGGD